MIEITNFRQGAILNHNPGVESDESLRICIEGISDHGCPVTVNGVQAEMDGRRFFAEIDLSEKINEKFVFQLFMLHKDRKESGISS